jgi:acetoin utilization deacetylase AcuC-like enzyme
LQAAQTAYACALELEQDPSTPVYALVRPPGHHAGPDYMGGYCYLNNAAIAARHLQKSGRVALLDIDYHHGNGTQEIFWDDPQVLYLSLHGDPDYPNYSGTSDEKGGVSALHANHNIPLPERTAGEQYLAALEQALATIQQFDPTWLVISLGVDTFKDDHVGNFALDLPDYAAIGQKLKQTQLPLLFIQEGGYNIKEVGNLVAELLQNACQ